MRICLIGHSEFYSNYGAATSLRLHMRSFIDDNEMLFFCISRKHIHPRRTGKKENTIPNLFVLKETWLPIMYSAISSQGINIKQLIFWEIIPNFLSFLFKKDLRGSLIQIKPDVIHLNSLTLLPLVPVIRKIKILHNVRIMLHVRELANPKKDLSRFLHLVDKIVCIDMSTFESLKKVYANYPVKTSIVNNPFIINRINTTTLKVPNDDCLNFAIVGVISEEKGVEFVLNSLLKSDLVNIRCYVVGKNNALKQRLQRIFNSSLFIHWVDEIDEFALNGGFSRIDFLIRGEKQFCTGRTVFEALMSGSGVIVPGIDKELQKDDSLRKYKEKVYLYMPRNEESLASLIKSIAKLQLKKDVIEGKYPMDNLSEYNVIFKEKYNELFQF